MSSDIYSSSPTTCRLPFRMGGLATHQRQLDFPLRRPAGPSTTISLPPGRGVRAPRVGRRPHPTAVHPSPRRVSGPLLFTAVLGLLRLHLLLRSLDRHVLLDDPA